MRPLSALVILTALIPLLSVPTVHACGLHQASIRRIVHTPDNHSGVHLSIPTTLRAATFQFKEGQGYYLESLTGIEYSPLPKLTLSAEASWVSLTVGSSHYSSVANPRLSLEYTPLTLSGFNATFGGRVEIPTAAASHRIAASHLELVPYTRLQWSRSAYHLSLQLGASVGAELPEASTEDHHQGVSADSMQFVNPHTERELLFQLRGGRQWLGDTLESSVFVDGQTVLADSDPGATFVSAGVSLSAQWGDHLLLSLDAERSVSTQQRFTWRTALGLRVLL
jgi:hypothetical protein